MYDSHDIMTQLCSNFKEMVINQYQYDLTGHKIVTSCKSEIMSQAKALSIAKINCHLFRQNSGC